MGSLRAAAARAVSTKVDSSNASWCTVLSLLAAVGIISFLPLALHVGEVEVGLLVAVATGLMFSFYSAFFFFAPHQLPDEDRKRVLLEGRDRGVSASH